MATGESDPGSTHDIPLQAPADPQFLLIPGFGGTGRLFRHLVELFPAGTHITIARYRTEADSIAELSQAATELVANWSRTVVISESMDSLVAVDLCRRFASPPRAAVFCAAFARSPRPFLLKLGLTLPSVLLHRLATHPLVTSSDEFCAMVPGIRRAHIVGPHFLLQASPRECLREIRAFLAGLDSPVSLEVPQTLSR